MITTSLTVIAIVILVLRSCRGISTARTQGTGRATNQSLELSEATYYADPDQLNTNEAYMRGTAEGEYYEVLRCPPTTSPQPTTAGPM
ncbi:hypothetical protein GBAR_LOCUS19055 [Geodia barretti]|uniref:Secreted protein n=1 Tax=Geodia barretti TaxID=519541 RepID=A0AA35SQF4_GEOBA|nr:hypothetical protein GBAR_LOCUS19055 [Geodia barretti]